MPSIHIRVFFYLILSLSNYIEMCISKEGVDLKAYNHYITPIELQTKVFL